MADLEPVIFSATIKDDLMQQLGIMEAARQRSLALWINSSSQVTKQAISTVKGVIMGLRRVFEYPDDERLVRAFQVLYETPFNRMLLAFRLPVVRNDDLRRTAAHDEMKALREHFRNAFLEFVNSLIKLFRADDVSPVLLARLKLEGPEKLTNFMAGVRDEVVAVDLEIGIVDEAVKVEADPPPPGMHG